MVFLNFNKMKKVALINPGNKKDISLGMIEPLNLGFIAAYLEKHRIEVRIIDQFAGQNIKKELRKFNPQIVGITSTTPLVCNAYSIADMCKNMGFFVVMGGIHPSTMPEEALNHCDIVVKGEGEKAFLDIVKKKTNEKIVSYPLIKDLSEIPHPARHLMDINYYLKTIDINPETHLGGYISSKTKTSGILSSRGCPYRCIFCHNSWRRSPPRYHSAEYVIEEIEELINNYDTEALFFFDDDLFSNNPRLKKICKRMKEKKIDIIWGCNARVNEIDLETLKMVKKAGCKQVNFGFESGSQRILSLLKNNTTTIEQNKRAVKLCKEACLGIHASFMIGNPTETKKDVMDTQEFIKKNPLDSIGVLLTTPFPGTELWEICKRRGIIPKNIDWNDFTTGKLAINCCENISKEELQRLYQETIDLTLTINKPSLKKYLNIGIKHPARSLATLIKYPSKIKNIAKSILIK